MAATHLTEIRARIAAAAVGADRTDRIELVVVTKYASDDQVRAVIDDGAEILGESRGQSLAPRAAGFPEVEWDFVGRLQRNKVNQVGSASRLLHSMDRTALADRWARLPDPPPVLVQVNLADEDQKGGVAPDEARSLVERCAELGIEVRGLMTVPPRGDTPGAAAPWFAALRELAEEVRRDHGGVTELSMGMTDDFEVAVAEGATILRIGRAIFRSSDDEG